MHPLGLRALLIQKEIKRDASVPFKFDGLRALLIQKEIKRRVTS